MKTPLMVYHREMKGTRLHLSTASKFKTAVVIRQDAHMLKYLDSRELLRADYTELFLPVLVSLANSDIGDATLCEWIRSKCSEKNASRLAAARAYSDDEEDKWTPVRAGQELNDLLRKMCSQDKKSKSKGVLRKRAFVISGKM